MPSVAEIGYNQFYTPLNMNIKRTLNFKLEQRKKKGVVATENVPIRMRLTFGGNRIEFSTGYRVDADKWDSTKQRVKPKYTNRQKITAADINANLSNYELTIQEVFKDFEVQDVMPTPEQLKERFEWYLAGKPEPTVEEETKEIPTGVSFWESYDEFVKERGRMNDWTVATYHKFAALKNHLTEHNANLSFDDMTENGLNDLVDFFRNTKNMRNSTIGKQLGYLKWFLKWAFQKKHFSDPTYMGFKAKLKSTDKEVIFLTADELKKLMAYEIPEKKKHLERVRDAFLFCCYSGLRHSDLFNLKRSDVHEDHISITTVKTAHSLRIELNDMTRAILDKYKDIPFKDNKALPVLTNQKMNDYIKELCKMAEINTPVRLTYYKGNERVDEVYPKHQLIGTHAGRRTFICTALSLNIPPDVIMKWTGHRSYKSMMPYIAIADKTKAEAMARFNIT